MTTKPIITLKKVKSLASLSEETIAYTADLYVDGVLLGHVSNHGQGGADEFHPAKGKTYNDYMEADKRVKATYPKSKVFGMELEESLESLCQTMVEHERLKTNFRSTLSRRWVLADGGKIYTAKKIKGREAAHLAKLKQSYPKAVFLNELAFDAAWELYYKHGVIKGGE